MFHIIETNPNTLKHLVSKKFNGYHHIPLMRIGKMPCVGVVTLALGLQPRQGLAKVHANSEARKSYFMLLGV